MGRRIHQHKSSMKVVFFMVMVALLVLGLYYRNTNKERTTEKEQVKNEVEVLLQKDLDHKYPETPREVVKIYLRIMKCYFNEEVSKDQLKGLAKQAYQLLDEELVQANPWKDYMSRLKQEISSFKEANKKIDRYQIDKGSAVRYYSKDGKDYASLMVEILSMDEKYRFKTSEQFILRKNDQGCYKILGWKPVGNADIDER